MKRVSKKVKVVMFDEPDLVEYRANLEGWTGPDGLYYGKGNDGERRARYANCTHKKCKCGDIFDKNSYCKSCNEKSAKDRFNKLEAIEWDGMSMMASSDIFFSCMTGVFEYCVDNEINLEDLELMHCELQVNISEINIDELNEEYMTEDGKGVSYYHPEISEKVEELNELIRNTKPKLWFQTNKRIKFTELELDEWTKICREL